VTEPSLDALVEEALDRVDGPDSRIDRRIARSLLTEALGLLEDQPHPLDLKIATNALKEMREAYEMFAPFRDRRKVTIFGSARTGPDDPVYLQTVRVAAELASRGWMVVTGAGPGIMQAGMEGAGREASIGVSIRLPFETGANPVIAGDAKYVSMKYFFTRKLMLIKESAAFVCLPGGFGTLDETFELLTLTQTGKGLPVPIVLLDTPDDPYWEAVDAFIREHLVARSMVDPDDVSLYRIHHDANGVAEEIEGFYTNYHSIRFVGDRLIIRLRDLPSPSRLDQLRRDFADLSRGGFIEAVEPTSAEIADADQLALARLAVDYDTRHAAGLRLLIDRLNAD
jgi:uncharacterized protein (TIGR00730 family)